MGQEQTFTPKLTWNPPAADADNQEPIDREQKCCKGRPADICCTRHRSFICDKKSRLRSIDISVTATVFPLPVSFDGGKQLRL
jgi:hypothetical protein